jgi:type II secretory pathway pseudopilin PulG
LIEVLAALVLMALVLPTVMEGITMASSLADMGRRRTEAAGLAQTYLANAVASQTWENGNLSGDCGPDWPGFSWEANVAPWPGDTAGAGLSEIDLTVTYNGNVRRKVAVTVSTLVYARSTATNPTNTSTNGL